METTLLIVTAVALLIALTMSLTAWRLNRDERRRAEARVAALTAAAGFAPAPAEPAKAPWAKSPISAHRQNIVDKPNRLRQGSGESAEAPRAAAEGLSLRDGVSQQADRPILGTTAEPQASGGRQRGLAAAAAVLLVALLGGVAWMMTGREPSAASAAPAPGAPLELVSLRHERQSTRLAVSGLVRNPAAGRPVDRLSAVVFLFDQQGAFVTSAKAPVDFMRLGSGDESPFVITMDAPGTIARYRVSFRTDQGVVPHVDRRGASPIASQAEQATSLPVK